MAAVTANGFTGNADNLAEFLLLRNSRKNDTARGEALMRWQAYNTVAVLTPQAKAGVEARSAG